jgi:hypothetical protein
VHNVQGQACRGAGNHVVRLQGSVRSKCVSNAGCVAVQSVQAVWTVGDHRQCDTGCVIQQGSVGSSARQCRLWAESARINEIGVGCAHNVFGVWLAHSAPSVSPHRSASQHMLQTSSVSVRKCYVCTAPA